MNCNLISLKRFFSTTYLVVIPILLCAQPTFNYNQLEKEVNQLWQNKSFVQLGYSLQSLLKLADTPEKKIDVLIQLHEYEAFHSNDSEKCLKHLLDAIELADHHQIAGLQMDTRSKLMFWHQATTRDQETVDRLHQEMKDINVNYNSQFHNTIIEQWEAQITGTQRFIGMPVSDKQVQKSVNILKETVQFWDLDTPSHRFYYQQARRNIIAYFGDFFEYETCLKYYEEIEEVKPFMRDPLVEIGNLMFKGAFYHKFDKHEELLKEYNKNKNLLLTANDGLSNFYYQQMGISYEELGDYKNALASFKKAQEFELRISKQAISNKVEALKLSKEKEIVQERNQSLSAQNKSIFTISILALLGLIGAYYSRLKINQANKTISKQKQNLEEINQAKNKLFGILAHDLRGPITGLNNLGQKINYLASKKDWDSIDAMMNQINQKTANLDGILQNILPWMSLQIKNPKLDLIPQALAPIINESYREVEHLSKAKNINISLPTNNQIAALIDKNALKIVLRNILNNAIKFTDRSGHIAINIFLKDKRCIIQITDDGVGMDEATAKNLFNDYRSSQGTEGETGHGLGLKLSKDLMTSMNGDIIVNSEKDRGTTFDLMFDKI